MQKKISLSVFIFVLIAAILVSFMSAFAVVSEIYRDRLANPYGVGDDAIDVRGLYLVDSLFKELSILDLDNDALINAVINGYVAATGDRYATYLNAEEYAAMLAEDSGTPQGIGIRIYPGNNGEYIDVVYVTPDSPADKAGLLVGDRIYYVVTETGRASVNELGYNNAVQSLQGNAGTYAEFTVLRDGAEVDFKILREAYNSRSVIYHLSESDPTVGIIKIIEFNLTTPTQFCEAMDDLISKGIGKFIFDVRDNPGGDLASIKAVLARFLEKGDTILTSQPKSGNGDVVKIEVRTYNDGYYDGCSITEEDIGRYRRLKYVVLVNENSASAAEVFAANFRDYELAQLVGVTTFGKGVMQSLFPLAGYGFEGMLKLTTAEYLPPSGEGYHGVGIIPDAVVELSDSAKKTSLYVLREADDAQLVHAISLLK